MTGPSPSNTLAAIKADAKRPAIQSQWHDVGIDIGERLEAFTVGKTVALVHYDWNDVVFIYEDGSAVKVGYRVFAGNDGDQLEAEIWQA